MPADRFGFDISWPQCRPGGAVVPPRLGQLAVVGITNGHPFSTNVCLGSEWRWALSRPQRSGYVNLAFPPSGGPAPENYGRAIIADAIARAHTAGIVMHGIWLDVEVGNHWSPDPAANAAVVRGALAGVIGAGLQPGVYSSPLDWQQITGGAALTVPVWQALPDGRRIVQSCGHGGFGGRLPDMVQAVFTADGHQLDGDLVCTTAPDLRRLIN